MKNAIRGRVNEYNKIYIAHMQIGDDGKSHYISTETEDNTKRFSKKDGFQKSLEGEQEWPPRKVTVKKLHK